MDSWAEVDWMGRFQELVAGRTAVIITHRFTTAMRADVIHVMESGRIVESGCHKELLAMGGRYAGSWNAQMRSERTNGEYGTSENLISSMMSGYNKFKQLAWRNARIAESGNRVRR